MAFFFHSKTNDPERMIRFLESEEVKKSKGHPIYFEVDYALNICKQKEKEHVESLTLKRMAAQLHQKAGQTDEHNLVAKRDMEDIAQLKNKIIMMKKAQIIIYAILNHFDKAVKIALECNDVKMAKQYANKPDDKKIRKKLWMKIAKYLFGYQGKKKNKN